MAGLEGKDTNIILLQLALYNVQYILHYASNVETAQAQLIHESTPSYFGAVIHYFNTSWHTVCDRNWTVTMSNSHVLCGQLGLGHALEHWLHDPDAKDTNFLHTHMTCNGTENRLTLCDHDFIEDNSCDARSVPWVLCSGEDI